MLHRLPHGHPVTALQALFPLWRALWRVTALCAFFSLWRVRCVRTLLTVRCRYAMGAVSGRFHIFLSHVWGTGQDQMRIVKQRLLEMMPDLSVFLDIDDRERHNPRARPIRRQALRLSPTDATRVARPSCAHDPP